MPKKVVKRLWCQGNQNIVRFAEMLRVSPRALRFRLDQLGLTEPPARCSRRVTQNPVITPTGAGV
jgi:hypothetical protein